VVKRTFGTALQLMYEYPQYTYTQSAAAYNEWMAQKYPDMNAEIKQRIKEGRWEIVGGMWVEPDLNMPDGESLVRQLLVGKRWYKQAYGVDVRIGWNPDSFGYNVATAADLQEERRGLLCYAEDDVERHESTAVQAVLVGVAGWVEGAGVFSARLRNEDLSPVRLSGRFATARQRSTGMTDMMDLYGVGDHGGGPTRAILDEGFHWAAPGRIPANGARRSLSSARRRAWFSAVEKQIAPESPEWNYQSIAKGIRRRRLRGRWRFRRGRASCISSITAA
jgi:alpha-mannosidase